MLACIPLFVARASTLETSRSSIQQVIFLFWGASPKDMFQAVAEVIVLARRIREEAERKAQAERDAEEPEDAEGPVGAVA